MTGNVVWPMSPDNGSLPASGVFCHKKAKKRKKERPTFAACGDEKREKDGEGRIGTNTGMDGPTPPATLATQADGDRWRPRRPTRLGTD